MTLEHMPSILTETDPNSAGNKRIARTSPVRKSRAKTSPAERAAGDEATQTISSLVRQAMADGDSITGPGGLLKKLTQIAIETALNVEMEEHLAQPRENENPTATPNTRNGVRTKTIKSDIVGDVEIRMPRDRDGSFEPIVVKKRQRRLTSLDEMVLSLCAHGLTYGEIMAHLKEIYGTSISKETISRITDRVFEEMNAWLSRPLDDVYAAVFIDATMVKVRDGAVANRPIYTAVGVTCAGNKEILGLWVGSHGNGESAKFWATVLADVKNRGVKDIMFVVCDGLKGLPNAVENVFPDTIVQTCVVHLLRNTYRYLPTKSYKAATSDLKRVYEAPNAAAAADAFEDFAEKWGSKYPAVVNLWRNAWEQFIPFLDYDLEVRRVIYSTNAIESLNARIKRAVRARGHFPNEQAAVKCLYLVIRSLDPAGRGQIAWSRRWKPALNAFALQFGDRWPATPVS